ncbi:UNVERIFIED_CONTAM: hypothetical protein O8I53_05740 [Campylobacter lari]
MRKLSIELGIDSTVYDGATAHNTGSEPQAAGARLEDAYKSAINSGIKYIFLNGFTQETPLTTILQDPTITKKIKDNKVVFITIDFTPNIQ